MLTDGEKQHKKFWTMFNNACITNNCKFGLQEAPIRGYYNINFGKSNGYIDLTYNTKTGELACGLYIPSDSKLYDHLKDHRDQINLEISDHLKWFDIDDRKASRIRLFYKEKLKNNADNWDTACVWLTENTKLFISVFSKYM